MNPVIVIPAYRRAKSLGRLLASLAAAEYPSSNVKLIISLEGGSTNDVRYVAEGFVSEKFETQVLHRDEKLGLRAHILACGDIAFKYGSVIILEDDLLVDRYFYRYALCALQYYAEDNLVAGIALYAPEYNEYAGVPFRPMNNGYSTYPMKVACSWGQCWTASQWRKFRDWYQGVSETSLTKISGLPCVVKSWPETSWKKYFSGYMQSRNLTLIYPYESFSTNCSDPGGEHVLHGSDIYQVSLSSQARRAPSFLFCPAGSDYVAYDSFMEPCGANVFRLLGLSKDEVEVDFYGVKPVEFLRLKKYALTCRSVESFIRHYPRRYRPLEYNLEHPEDAIDSQGFSLVDRAEIEDSGRRLRNLNELSYFSGMNIGSSAAIRAIMSALPGLIFSRTFRAFERYFNK